MEPAKLTTMVVLYTTRIRLDTTYLAHHLPLSDRLIKIEKQGVLKRGESKKDRVRKRTVVVVPKRTTGFGHNSITMVVLSRGDGHRKEKEITVKIFQNGVFHITGVLDETYDRDVMRYIRSHINYCSPKAILGGIWDPEVRRVVLMNYKTKIRDVTNLSRERLSASLRRLGFKTNYEPAVYPAVKVYFPDTKWIAKIFRTGNIILTGMTAEDECRSLMWRLDEALEHAQQSMQNGWHGSAIQA
jgi:TATA-box binding protein (TBP) (component of TFIID and TFIIIB)